MKRSTAARVLLACAGLLACDPVLAEPPSGFVHRLVKAIKSDDFDTIYRFDYSSQSMISFIKETEPKFLWEQKLLQHYQESKSAYFTDKSDAFPKYFIQSHYEPLARLFIFDPHVEVVEVQETTFQKNYQPWPAYAVYVRLRFGSVESSPIVPRNSLSPVTPHNFSSQVALSEAIVRLKFSREGQFISGERLADQDVAWQDFKKQMVACHVGGDAFDLQVRCYLLGPGTLGEARATIGSYAFPLEHRDDNTLVGRVFGQATLLPNKEARNIPFTVAFTHGDGSRETLEAVMPQLTSPSGLVFIRQSWKVGHRWKRRANYQALFVGSGVPVGDLVVVEPAAAFDGRLDSASRPLTRDQAAEFPGSLQAPQQALTRPPAGVTATARGGLDKGHGASANPKFAEIEAEFSDARFFPERSMILGGTYDATWNTLEQVLTEQRDRFVTKDKLQGIITTEVTRHGLIGFPTYQRYLVLVERHDDSNSKVTLKVLRYFLAGSSQPSVVQRETNQSYIEKEDRKFIRSIELRLAKQTE